MENVAGEQHLVLRQVFPYISSYSSKTSDWDLKLFVIFDMLFPFLAFVKL